MFSFKTASILLAYLTLESVAVITKRTQSQPNPISSQYPHDATGTINGTVAVIPIPYSTARELIPKEYAILRNTYLSLLPDFDEDLYPAMLQSELDHDITDGGLAIPDFSRSSISFPFVDRLGDGYTSMTYGKHILLSGLNLVAIGGTELYGYTVTGAFFNPKQDAYKCAAGDQGCKTKYFAAYDALQPLAGPKISHNFTASSDKSPFSLSFYKNITNQPQFSDNKLFCDNYIRLFNSSVTKSPYEPQFVRGTVSVMEPFYAEDQTWTDVWGLQLDNAFIERNYKDCKSLQGYTFSG